MIEAYPLHWPTNKARTPATKRQRAHFGTQTKGEYYNSRKQISVYEATSRILAELNKYTRVGQTIRVPKTSIIISTNIPVRKDGLPYSNFREPDDPGAAVYFTLDKRPYCLPCDKWDRVADNLAAIAAHIAANRGIERWGVGESIDVYRGFTALPETIESAKNYWEILGFNGQPKTFDEVKAHYRQLLKERHPDTGGSEEAFHELQGAFEFAKSIFNQQ